MRSVSKLHRKPENEMIHDVIHKVSFQDGIKTVLANKYASRILETFCNFLVWDMP